MASHRQLLLSIALFVVAVILWTWIGNQPFSSAQNLSIIVGGVLLVFPVAWLRRKVLDKQPTPSRAVWITQAWVPAPAREATARGSRYIDCPVAGRPDAAEKGELRIYVGGAKEDLEVLRPLLETFSKKIFHFGPVGAGTAYKLIYNLLGVVQVASVAEAMVQCEAAGIDLNAAAEGFAIGYTGSRHVSEHSARMAEGKRNQPVGFAGSGRLKDAIYGVKLAEKLGRQALVGEAAAQVFDQMVQAGMGGLNDSEVIDAIRAAVKKK